MTDTAPPVEEKKASVEPGDLTAKLVECREKAGLDIDQAAEELHLSVHILQALEREDFTRLPEPPYVRGYLRGYAKLADTDARELIRTYEALRGANPDEIAHHFAPARPLNKVTQPAISSSTLKFIGFGALVLLLGLVSMIPGVREWASHTWASFSAQTNPPDVPRPPSAMDAYVAQKAAQEREKAQEEQQAKQAAAQQQAAAPAVPAASSAQDTPAAQDATASTTVTPATEPTPTQTADADTSASLDSPAITSATADATNTAAATPGATTQNAPATDAASPTPAASADQTGANNPVAPAADGTTAQQTPTGALNIKMEFAEDVWLQIKGHENKTLFESLNTGGSIKEFQAATPLSFKVGNAPGVKIYINGQLFDQTPYVKGSVARFKLD